MHEKLSLPFVKCPKSAEMSGLIRPKNFGIGKIVDFSSEAEKFTVAPDLPDGIPLSVKRDQIKFC